MPQQTIDQFGATIKAKHPEYKDIPDAQLGQKVLAKYPQYQDMIAPPPRPDDPKGYAPLHEARDVVKGAAGLLAPPSTRGEALANAISPVSGPAIYRQAKGYLQSLQEGVSQAKKYQSQTKSGDTLTDFLNYVRSGTTLAGAVNPLSSGSVTQANRLFDAGRPNEATGRGLTDALLMLLGGKHGEGAADTAVRAAKNPMAPVRILAQEAGGAGKEVVLKANRAREEAIAAQRGVHQERVANVEKANQEKLTKQQADEEKLREDKSAYAQKEHGVRQAERGAQAATAQKEVVARGQQEYSRLIDENIKNTQKATKGALDARWNSISEKMSKPQQLPNGAIRTAPVEGRPIRAAIEQAQNDFLVGSPQDLADFKNLMGRLSDPAIDAADYAKPLNWNEARTHFTNISNRLYAGGLQANVFQALKLVRDSLDEQLSKAATSRGLGKEYSSLKRDWSQYKSDFDDLSNMSTGGGSPLARAVRFTNPADMQNLLKGRYGEDVAARLAPYRNRGANPQLVTKYRELGRRAEGIQAPKVPAHPAKITRTVEPAQLKPRPPLPTLPPEVQPYEIRLRKLEELSGRPASIWDLYPVRAVERLALKSPALRRWIASQPRTELKP